MKLKLAFLCVLAACPLIGSAETAYVTDILRLGIHHAEDTSDRPFDNLVSGTELEILDRIPNFAHVRTKGGDEGWVKSAYLVTEKPAQLRVAEVEAELAHLKERLEAAKSAQAAAEQSAEQAGRQLASSTSSTDAIQDTLARLKQENDGYAAQLELYRGALPLPWVAAALVVALVAGFVAGLWWLDATIRRRHGGFRVY
jgi:SH3 domain protein